LAEAQTAEAGSGAEAEIVALEAQAQAQDAQLVDQVQEVSEVGGDLQETQAQADGAVARSRQLSQQADELQGALESQQGDYVAAENRYKEQVRAAYKGDNVEGLIGILDSVVASDEDSGTITRVQVRNVLVQSQQRIEDYRRSRQKVKNTVRQVSQKRSDYQEALKEERAKIRELRRKEEDLESAISRVRGDSSRTDARIQRLQEAERQRISRTRPATGAPAAQRSRELRVARNDIVARPVKPMSKKRYRKLYRQSAKRYGFGKDWYILAAVGKVETNHGENMGPSSAGAMGPMQFMPSTWESSGVDGNGDGVANVMDPEDAIPAAARYLKTGGAPKDWYAALYSYNHADWYVKKVLGVAEGYRRLASDNRVGPYA
jgi:peptidoglycan hydrolase CwlO-like protein